MSGAAQRGCGSCGACCTVLAVEALAKGPREDCVQLVPLRVDGGADAGAAAEGRCGAYEARPQACRTFKCFWLLDGAEALLGGRLAPARLLEDGERPDLVGLMVQAASLGDAAARRIAEGAFAAGGAALIIHEVWGGAAHSGPGERMLKRLARRFLLIVNGAGGGTATVGPRALVDMVAQGGAVSAGGAGVGRWRRAGPAA